MKILIVLAVIVIAVIITRKNKSSGKTKSYEEMRDEIGIELSPEQEKREEEKYHEIAEQTISALEASGYFKADYLPILADKIRERTVPGYRYSDPFDKKDCLTLEEKKKLGLNTRAKYSRELINGLTEKGLSTEDPNELVKNTWLANMHKVSRKYKLQELKDAGFKYVKILHCNDERDCKAVKLCKKRWPIDEVPELPLPNCNSPYCRCMYVSDVKDFKNDIDLSKLRK